MSKSMLPSPGEVAKKSARKGAKRVRKAAAKGAARKGRKTAKRSGAKSAGGVRSKLKGYASSARGKQFIAAVVHTAEFSGAAAGASALAAYRRAQGKSMSIGPVDVRIPVGIGLQLLSLWKSGQTNTHLMAVGTGVLTSWLVEKATEWGASKATGASAEGIVVGKIGFGKKGKDARIQRRLDRIEKRTDKVQTRLADGKAESRSRPSAQKRKVYVIPQDGAYQMPQGRYHKVGALASF